MIIYRQVWAPRLEESITIAKGCRVLYSVDMSCENNTEDHMHRKEDCKLYKKDHLVLNIYQIRIHCILQNQSHQHTIYNILYTLHAILHTVEKMLYTIYYILLPYYTTLFRYELFYLRFYTLSCHLPSRHVSVLNILHE